MKCTACAGTGTSCTPLSQETIYGMPAVIYDLLEQPCFKCKGTGFEPKQTDKPSSNSDSLGGDMPK